MLILCNEIVNIIETKNVHITNAILLTYNHSIFVFAAASFNLFVIFL